MVGGFLQGKQENQSVTTVINKQTAIIVAGVARSAGVAIRPLLPWLAAPAVYSGWALIRKISNNHHVIYSR